MRDLKLEWGVSVGGWVFMYILCLHAVYSCVYDVIGGWCVCVCVCVCVWNLYSLQSVLVVPIPHVKENSILKVYRADKPWVC